MKFKSLINVCPFLGYKVGFAVPSIVLNPWSTPYAFLHQIMEQRQLGWRGRVDEVA